MTNRPSPNAMPPNCSLSRVVSQSMPLRLVRTAPGQPQPHVATITPLPNATPFPKPGECPQSHGLSVPQEPSYQRSVQEEPSRSQRIGSVDPQKCGSATWSHARSPTHVRPSSHEIVERPTMPTA